MPRVTGLEGNFSDVLRKTIKNSFKEATPSPTKTHDWAIHAYVLKKEFFLVYKIKLGELIEQKFEFDLNINYRRHVSYFKKTLMKIKRTKKKIMINM